MICTSQSYDWYAGGSIHRDGVIVNVDEKQERLIEVAAALLAASTGQRMQTTNLNKALFYVDLASLRDLGETLTGNSYLALNEGPVIAKYPQRLIRALEHAGLAEQGHEGQSKPIVLRRQPPVQYVTTAVSESVGRVAKWCSEKTAKEISDISHRNLGWISAYEEGLGEGGDGKPHAINLSLAMQQIMDDDPWLAAPLDEEATEALAAADQNAGQGW